MALRIDQAIAAKINDGAQRPAIPILHRADLEEHRRLPDVQARLKRVRALIASRAQQKV